MFTRILHCDLPTALLLAVAAIVQVLAFSAFA